ncbi:MAG: hypothetical protein KGI60_00025 [Patescibacteria group bacterium]|nr:hypothetical protein [Patescibacteria group bacterium]
MELNFKNKRELTFLSIGILMVIMVSLSAAGMIYFLLANVNGALTKQAAAPQGTVRFELNAATALIKK